MPKRSFEPVCDEHTRLLILGSLPGDKALALRQYYGNPQNHFWRLMERVLQEPLVPLAYEDRLHVLLGRGVGLWDVIGAAEREGSLDAAIRNVSGNDLLALTSRLPRLQAVAFNGSTSARLGRPRLEGETRLTLVQLPSSSPARAMRFDDKAAAWTVLRRFIEFEGGSA
ncbi:MAG TPA: DNA-deoxyinosine glycosylase [Caulobacteraceae bacterium]|jgi:hypoxanthine-DNA glycosylase